jgi:hypothetical protein
MDLRDVTVATMTWARTPEEEQLLRRTLTALTALGVPAVIADRPVRPEFSQSLLDLPRVEVCNVVETGLPIQIAAALDRATGHATRFVLYTEPDKESFFREHLVDFVRAAPDAADVGVVLAARSPEGFATFPRMQRYTETVVNELCREVIGIDGDYTYGPFLIAPALVSGVGRLDNSLGWGWRPFVFREARRMGLRVCHLEGDYRCPLEQSSEGDSDRAHRLAQLSQNIRGLIA